MPAGTLSTYGLDEDPRLQTFQELGTTVIHKNKMVSPKQDGSWI